MVTSREILKTWFETGDKPTEKQFASWLDSYLHKNDTLGIDTIGGLAEYLNERNEALIESVNSIIVDAQKELQLQRRIALVMERTTQVVPIGEDMIIYHAKGSNISKLEVKPNNANVTEWNEIELDNNDIEIELLASDFEYIFRVTSIEDLMDCSIYLLAKVKQ